MSNGERLGIECAERLLDWVIFEGDSGIRIDELKEILLKVFGTSIYEQVEYRAKNGLTLTPIGDK